jgi:hypothetical protein
MHFLSILLGNWVFFCPVIFDVEITHCSHVTLRGKMICKVTTGCNQEAINTGRVHEDILFELENHISEFIVPTNTF